MVMVPYLTAAHLKFVVPYLTAPGFTLGIIRTVRLFTCSGVGPFFLVLYMHCCLFLLLMHYQLRIKHPPMHIETN